MPVYSCRSETECENASTVNIFFALSSKICYAKYAFSIDNNEWTRSSVDMNQCSFIDFILLDCFVPTKNLAQDFNWF